MIKDGIELNLETLSYLKMRLQKHFVTLAKKIPHLIGESLKGGVAGFLSNLVTFLINQFLSTSQRVVTIIREGLMGIYKAFKIIFFPPEGMSKEEIWRNAIKVLTTSITIATTVSFTEALKIFLNSFPILSPVSDVLSSVMIGIIGGLASAFLVYTIDSVFDKLGDNYDERMMDMLMSNTEKRIEFSNQLVAQINGSLRLMENYNNTIGTYNSISSSYTQTKMMKNSVKNSTELMCQEVEDLIFDTQTVCLNTKEQIENIEKSQQEIELFLNKYDV